MRQGSKLLRVFSAVFTGSARGRGPDALVARPSSTAIGGGDNFLYEFFKSAPAARQRTPGDRPLRSLPYPTAAHLHHNRAVNVAPSAPGSHENVTASGRPDSEGQARGQARKPRGESKAKGLSRELRLP